MQGVNQLKRAERYADRLEHGQQLVVITFKVLIERRLVIELVAAYRMPEAQRWPLWFESAPPFGSDSDASSSGCYLPTSLGSVAGRTSRVRVQDVLSSFMQTLPYNEEFLKAKVSLPQA